MKYHSSKIFFLLFSLMIPSISQTTIKGIVVDTLGNPIQNAHVRLAIAGLKDSTDVNGQFVLTSISTGNPSTTYNKQLSINPIINNNNLVFSVFEPSAQVTVDVFGASGRLVAQVFHKCLLNGEFNLDLAYLLHYSCKNAVYFVRLKIGNDVHTIKWAPMNATGAKSGGSTQAILKLLPKINVSADSGVIDTIIVTRDGYYDEYKNVFSYSSNIGIIKLLNGKMPTIAEQDTIKMAIYGLTKVVSKIDSTIPVDSAMKEMLLQCDTIKMTDSMWISGSFVCAKLKYGGICSWDFTKDIIDTSGKSFLNKVQSNHLNFSLRKSHQTGQAACILVGGGDDVYNAAWPINFVRNDLEKYYDNVDVVSKSDFTMDFISNKLPESVRNDSKNL